MTKTNTDGLNTQDALEFEIEILDSEATEEDLDRQARNLLSELKETEAEVNLVSIGTAPEGSKGDPITIGTLAMTALPVILPGVIDMIKDWANRGKGRTVKFKGKGIEFEGSPEELAKLLASLNNEQSGGEGAPSLQEPQAQSKSSGPSRVFISYRRSDSIDVTGRIYDHLVAHFGKSAIFKDVDSIPPGVDFREHLETAVGSCEIFLAVIGNDWAEVTDSKNRSRLKDPNDFVRIEVESALNRNILVIPLLVRGAAMPAEKQLPPSLRQLVYRNALSVRPDPDFHGDMDRLIHAISNYSNELS